MKRRHMALVALVFLFASNAQSQGREPLELINTIKMASDVGGKFDHFGVYLKHQRLFATAGSHKSVEVLDVRTGKLIHSIGGVEHPMPYSIAKT